MIPIAMLESKTKLDQYEGRKYFFWPQMSRTSAEIEDYEYCFDFEDELYLEEEFNA